MSENKNFIFKVPKTKPLLIKEILKRWWYAKDFQEQAKRAFGFSQIASFLPKKKENLNSNEKIPNTLPPEIGKLVFYFKSQ